MQSKDSVADLGNYNSGKMLTIKLKQELIQELQVGVCNLSFFKIFASSLQLNSEKIFSDEDKIEYQFDMKELRLLILDVSYKESCNKNTFLSNKTFKRSTVQFSILSLWFAQRVLTNSFIIAGAKRKSSRS